MIASGMHKMKFKFSRQIRNREETNRNPSPFTMGLTVSGRYDCSGLSGSVSCLARHTRDANSSVVNTATRTRPTTNPSTGQYAINILELALVQLLYSLSLTSQ